jgi:heptosyltransferase-2
MGYSNILIIQTAYLGDVILATPVLEKLHAFYPDAKFDFLVRKGNEQILLGHPLIDQVLVWNKKQKSKALLQLTKAVKSKGYDMVINLHRFASSGMVTAFSGAPVKIGFHKNPFAIFFTKVVKHEIAKADRPLHEIERNLSLIHHLTDDRIYMPRLYPRIEDYAAVKPYQQEPYLCVAPASVWFTKQFPPERWTAFLQELPATQQVYLIGGPSDIALAESIRARLPERKVTNLCGKLHPLASAALMQDALLNFVNDSGPMHIASAMNAPTCAVYCSTVPAFGFGPLADFRYIVQSDMPLYCRPCGLHGYKSCPERHFKCAYDIAVQQLLDVYYLALDRSVPSKDSAAI